MSNRDFALARIAIAQTAARNVLANLDEALSLFVDPADDERGDGRVEAIQEAAFAARLAVEQLQLAETGTSELTESELAAGELDEEADEEEDDEE